MSGLRRLPALYLLRLPLFCLALLAASPAAFAADLQQMQDSINALLQAHQRAAPEDGAAGAFRERIRAAQAQAQRQQSAGDAAAAGTTLEQAYRQLTLAIRDLNPQAGGPAAPDAAAAQAEREDGRLQMDYVRQRAAVVTLLQILRTQGGEAKAAEMEPELRQADQLRGQDTAAALARLQDLYDREKRAVRSLKAGADAATANTGTAADDGPLQRARDDFERLDASIAELLQAQARILREEHPQEVAEQRLADSVRHLRDEARQRLAEDPVGAGASLRQAYAMIQQSVVRLRQGQTLTRSLNFDTPQDEYAYELQRHDMHLQLADLLLGAKRDDAAVGRLAERVLASSAGLRRQAEQSAAGGDHAKAVQQLEQASSEIYKLFRIAGIYVPD